jgi:hypothetical protein
MPRRSGQGAGNQACEYACNTARCFGLFVFGVSRFWSGRKVSFRSSLGGLFGRRRGKFLGCQPPRFFGMLRIYKAGVLLCLIVRSTSCWQTMLGWVLRGPVGPRSQDASDEEGQVAIIFGTKVHSAPRLRANITSMNVKTGRGQMAPFPGACNRQVQEPRRSTLPRNGRPTSGAFP